MSWKDAFETSIGYHQSDLTDRKIKSFPPIPDDVPPDFLWQSRTVFGENDDDGLAFLRDPGAFLAPNHFASSGHFNEFATWNGANIILTHELIAVMFTTQNFKIYNTRNFVDLGISL